VKERKTITAMTFGSLFGVSFMKTRSKIHFGTRFTKGPNSYRHIPPMVFPPKEYIAKWRAVCNTCRKDIQIGEKFHFQSVVAPGWKGGKSFCKECFKRPTPSRPEEKNLNL
jgi:hypothetical protein